MKLSLPRFLKLAEVLASLRLTELAGGGLALLAHVHPICAR
ncbi:MAG: hypothetical protein ACE5I3_04495 [Phycisphaerae bacterium]